MCKCIPKVITGKLRKLRSPRKQARFCKYHGWAMFTGSSTKCPVCGEETTRFGKNEEPSALQPNSTFPPGTTFTLCACKRHVPAPCDPTCPDYRTGRHPLSVP